MITINLFDHKRIVTEVKVQQRIVTAVAFALTGLIVVLAWWGLQEVQVSQQVAETENMQKLVASKEPHYKKVVGMKKEKKAVLGIIGKIDTLRNPPYETPQLMEDLSERIPEGVWLTSVTQMPLSKLRTMNVPVLFIPDDKGKKKAPKKGEEVNEHLFIELQGMAKVDQAIVRYMEQLEEVTYLDNIFLQSTKQKWIGLEEVRQFKIYCHVANPALTNPLANMLAKAQ